MVRVRMCEGGLTRIPGRGRIKE
ncbi:MAG: hypothetical protein QOD94_3127, partial [Alphaproteobacteria bacterium]|nr:hypothetical protein [Alphaproteobacteria bacterium]